MEGIEEMNFLPERIYDFPVEDWARSQMETDGKGGRGEVEETLNKMKRTTFYFFKDGFGMFWWDLETRNI